MPPRPAWKDSLANKGDVWQISRTGQVNINQKVQIRSELDFRELSGHTTKIFDCWNHLSCNLVQLVGQRYGGNPSRGTTQMSDLSKKRHWIGNSGCHSIRLKWRVSLDRKLVLKLPANTHLKLYKYIQCSWFCTVGGLLVICKDVVGTGGRCEKRCQDHSMYRWLSPRALS